MVSQSVQRARVVMRPMRAALGVSAALHAAVIAVLVSVTTGAGHDAHIATAPRRSHQPVSVDITRIEDGTFGRCERCGKAISKEELRALPYSRHCVPCTEKLQ